MTENTDSEIIVAYVLGDLPPLEKQRFEELLDHSSDLRHALTEIETTVHLLQYAGEAAPTTEKNERTLSSFNSNVSCRQCLQIVERLPIPVFRVKPDGEFVAGNLSLKTLLKIPSRQALLRVTFRSFCVREEDWTHFRTRVEDESCVPDFQLRLRRSDGTLLHTRLTAQAVRDQNDETLIYIEGIIQDTSLVHSMTQRIEYLFDKMPIAAFEINLAGLVVRANSKACALFGSVVGGAFVDLLRNRERERYLFKLNLASESNNLSDLPKYGTMLLSDNQPIPVSFRYCFLDGDAGDSGFLVIAEDISAEQEVRVLAETSKLLFETLKDSLPLRMFKKNLRHEFVDVNSAFRDEVNLPEDYIIGRTDRELFPSRWRKYQSDDRVVFDSGQVLETTEIHTPPGGKSHEVQVVKVPTYGSDSRLNGVLGVYWDVDRRDPAVAALRRIKEQMEDDFRRFFENCPIGAYQCTVSGRFLRANESLARILGYSSADALISEVDDIGTQIYVDPSFRVELICQLERSPGPLSLTFLAYRKLPNNKRDVIKVASDIHPVLDGSGKILYVQGFLRPASRDLVNECFGEAIDSLENENPS